MCGLLWLWRVGSVENYLYLHEKVGPDQWFSALAYHLSDGGTLKNLNIQATFPDQINQNLYPWDPDSYTYTHTHTHTHILSSLDDSVFS